MTSPVAFEPAQRRCALELPDKRTLQWHEWGPESGKPLVFCTGAGMSGSLGFGGRDLERLGIRLIAPDRPGLGGSSCHAEKTLASVAEDVAAVLMHLRADNCMVLGFSQGAPFAVALARRCQASGLAVVAGQDQLRYPPTYALLNDDVRTMIQQRSQSPEAFEAWIAANVDAERLMDFIMKSSSEIDLAFYSQPSFSAVYRQCLHEGFAQGGAGYARDLSIAIDAWPAEPEDELCPVHLWYGKKDASTVHSPDFGMTLASRFPNAKHFLLADEGGSILWKQSSLILEKLISTFPNP